MNLESRLKAELVAACRDLGAYARRHEDRYALGLLDLAIKFPGYPHLLAEAKVVAHQTFAPSLRQYLEGKRYTDAGGLCALIGFDKKTKAMFIHDWAEAATKADSFPPGGGYKPHAETLRDWLKWRATR
jgi:hypothetical protein